MASLRELNRLLLKAVRDERFRKRLFSLEPGEEIDGVKFEAQDLAALELIQPKIEHLVRIVAATVELGVIDAISAHGMGPPEHAPGPYAAPEAIGGGRGDLPVIPILTTNSGPRSPPPPPPGGSGAHPAIWPPYPVWTPTNAYQAALHILLRLHKTPKEHLDRIVESFVLDAEAIYQNDPTNAGALAMVEALRSLRGKL